MAAFSVLRGDIMITLYGILIPFLGAVLFAAGFSLMMVLAVVLG